MSNRFGLYYAYFCNSNDIDWKNCIKRSKNVGFGVCELSAVQFRNKPRQFRHEIAMYIKELGMNLSFATGLSYDTDISSDNISIRQSGIDTLKRDIELCYEMGGTKIGGIIYGVHKNMPQGVVHIRDKLLDRAASSLREVVKTAGDYGITLAVEIVNRFESPILNTVSEGIRFIEEIDHPSIGLLLDTFHMNIEEDDLSKAIISAGKHIKHMHFCENNRKLPGQGHIPWKYIAKALTEVNYNDTIVIESLPFPYGSVSDRLNIWRNLIKNDLEIDIATSLRFINKLFIH